MYKLKYISILNLFLTIKKPYYLNATVTLHYTMKFCIKVINKHRLAMIILFKSTL